MPWTHYRLCFQLLSPLHVGERKVGNLMETRPYVPGRTLRGALVARLTQDAYPSPQPQDYIRIRDQVKKYFRLGYLWPSLDGQSPYFPWEHEEEWDYMLKGSHIGTPLDPARGSAEMGGLHEIEFIAPFTRDGRPVYFIGDLWVKDGADAQFDWRDAMKRLRLGGERTYGWGRVRLLADLNQGTQGKGTTVFGQRWREQDGEVILTVQGRLTAHAIADAKTRSRIRGWIEPFLGRETQGEAGFGGHLPPPRICWRPGSEVNGAIEMKVDLDGILMA